MKMLGSRHSKFIETELDTEFSDFTQCQPGNRPIKTEPESDYSYDIIFQTEKRPMTQKLESIFHPKLPNLCMTPSNKLLHYGSTPRTSTPYSAEQVALEKERLQIEKERLELERRRMDIEKKRSDVFHGIMAAHIFPSLADVLTESLGIDDSFGPLDLSLGNMETNVTNFGRSLEENDFLNQSALVETTHTDTKLTDSSSIQDLSQPADLLVHYPTWAQETEAFDDNGEVGLVELVVDMEEDIKDIKPYPYTNHKSLGSTGDGSDYSSDSSDQGSDMNNNDGMIVLEKVAVKSEPLLPDESILYTCDMDNDNSDTESDSNMSSEGPHAWSKKKRPGRKKGQTSSVYHLWEFIRDLLKDPKFCPKIIKWENKPEGIFRVVQSNEVAKLWGSKKKNRSKMTYEKLSRSLRYSRKEGYFADIPKDKGYPKKLCFKFGPKSHGWEKYS